MLLIRNGQVHTMDDDQVYADGYVLCGDDGRILEVGAGAPAPVPAGCEVVDAEGGWVLPGWIDAHCHIGVFNDGLVDEGSDGNEITDPVTPQLRAVDAIFHQDRCYGEAVAGGVTSAMTGPGSANVIGGQFVFMKTVGRFVDEMAISAPAAMKMALGENPKRCYGPNAKTPQTRMATASILRDTLSRAREYAHKRQDPDESKRPAWDMKMEALLPVLDGRLPAKIHAHRADDILTAVRVCDEFGLRYTIDHCTEGYLVVDVLVEAYLRGRDDPEAGTGRGKGKLEGVMVGPLLSDRSKPELSRQDIRNPGLLAGAGLPVAILTDHPVIPIQYLPISAGVAAREGMGESTALRAITIEAARLCGMDHRVGSLAVGKDADIQLLDGHPFDLRTRVKQVWVDGKCVSGSSR